MRIEIAIPTLGRVDKLLKCLGSVEDAKKQIEGNLYLYLYFSSEIEYKLMNESLRRYPWILLRLIDTYNAAEFWNNHFKDCFADLVYYFNDDVILDPYCLKNSIDSMFKYFPDGDGVVGICQENLPIKDQCKAAFGVIGQKFMQRFPKKQIFCPEYKRFYLDTELYEYSSKIGKHYFDETSKLIHLHPNYSNYKADTTHFDVRKHLKEDQKTYNLRKKKGLLWGLNF